MNIATVPTPSGDGAGLKLTVQPQDVSTFHGNDVQLSCYISSTGPGESSADYTLYWRKQNGKFI